MREDIVNKIATIVLEYYSGYPHLMREDILHTQEVVSYTRMIATNEQIAPDQIELLEMAAWLHDIGCPRSKEIYGNSLPANQQSVGREVARELISDIDQLTAEHKKWIEDVVGTHHQFTESQTLKFAPLFEADLIVNILSGYYKKEQANHLYHKLVTTNSGKKLFKLVVSGSLGIEIE